MDAATTSRLEVVPLTKHIGAEIRGIDLPDNLDGDTLFVSGYAAYDTLDPAIRARLEGRKALNHYNYGTTIRGDTSKAVQAFNESVHPVFRIHDETGRKAIYVDRLMSMKIVDMS